MLGKPLLGKPLPPPASGGTMLTKMLGIDPGEISRAGNELMKLARGYDERLQRIEHAISLLCAKQGITLGSDTARAANGPGGDRLSAPMPANGAGGAAPAD